jgi:hypothetical protein
MRVILAFALAVPFALVGTPHSLSATFDLSEQPITQMLPQGALRVCEEPQYRPPPNDKLPRLLQRRKLYQLVIAADQYKFDPDVSNRPYVRKTAALVSKTLLGLQYQPVSGLDPGEPYLSGANATKQRIKEAVADLVTAVGSSGIGIVYYIGHGSITPNRRDLSLSVYDAPIAEDEGIRLTDLISTLSLKPYPSSVIEIPKFIIVLETCYSGNALRRGGAEPRDVDGLKILADVDDGLAPSPPPQLVLLSATAEGSASRAYELAGTGMSAFGFFFSRAFTDDWACVDSSMDGIITASELEGYLKERLEFASRTHLIEAPMAPKVRDDQRFSFLAYDSSRYYREGDSARVIEVSLSDGAIATLTLPDGTLQRCPPDCSVYVSASLQGSLTIEVPQTRYPGVHKGPAGDKPVPLPGDTVKGRIAISELVRARNQGYDPVVRLDRDLKVTVR